MSEYLYGIIRTPAPVSFDMRGLEDAEVRAVTAEDVAAIVSRFDGEKVRSSRKNLMAHSEILEKLFVDRTVLPVGFGTILQSEDDVRLTVLEQQKTALIEGLDRFNGMAELTLKGFYDEDKLIREVMQNSPVIESEKARAQRSSGENAYLANVRLGEMVAAEIATVRERDAGEMVAALEGLATETKVSPPVMDTMVLNAAFLVARSGVEEFDEAVREIGDRLSNRIRLRYVGPLPPYDFVHIPVRTASETASERTWAS